MLFIRSLLHTTQQTCFDILCTIFITHAYEIALIMSYLRISNAFIYFTNNMHSPPRSITTDYVASTDWDYIIYMQLNGIFYQDYKHLWPTKEKSFIFLATILRFPETYPVCESNGIIRDLIDVTAKANSRLMKIIIHKYIT